MTQVQQGTLMIADISGYTVYLNESELEHAQSVLQTLLEVLIENTRIPLVISRLEGDAVISYARDGSFLQGASVLEMVEACYNAYRRAIDLMMVNTTCTCNACKNISHLDLKFFLHHGEFALQPLPTYTELVGRDVNIIHRLTKNHIKEQTGYKAYALFTRAAVEALGIQGSTEEMAQVQESYEDVGLIEAFVKDMHPVWESGRDEARIIVREEEAIGILEFDFPVPMVQLWDYLVNPEMRAIYLGSEKAVAENLRAGRVGEGTKYVCAHGSMVVTQTIVDWQPFETHTTYDLGMGLPGYSTYRLSETESGSHLKVLIGPIVSKNPIKRWAGEIIVRVMLWAGGTKGLERMRRRMEEDLARGDLYVPENVELDLAALRESMRAALTAKTGEEKT
jgi:hypothetical protein